MEGLACWCQRDEIVGWEEVEDSEEDLKAWSVNRWMADGQPMGSLLTSFGRANMPREACCASAILCLSFSVLVQLVVLDI